MKKRRSWFVLAIIGVAVLASIAFAVAAYKRHFLPHPRLSPSSPLMEPMTALWNCDIHRGTGNETEFAEKLRLRAAILDEVEIGSRRDAVLEHLKRHYLDLPKLFHPGGPSDRQFFPAQGYYDGHGVGSDWIEVRYWIRKDTDQLDEVEILFRSGWL